MVITLRRMLTTVLRLLRAVVIVPAICVFSLLALIEAFVGINEEAWHDRKRKLPKSKGPR